jgi:hypothetical protein
MRPSRAKREKTNSRQDPKTPRNVRGAACPSNIPSATASFQRFGCGGAGSDPADSRPLRNAGWPSSYHLRTHQGITSRPGVPRPETCKRAATASRDGYLRLHDEQPRISNFFAVGNAQSPGSGSARGPDQDIFRGAGTHSSNACRRGASRRLPAGEGLFLDEALTQEDGMWPPIG